MICQHCCCQLGPYDNDTDGVLFEAELEEHLENCAAFKKFKANVGLMKWLTGEEAAKGVR